MEEWVRRFLEAGRVGRLATVDAAGHPHVIPIVYGLSRERIYTPLDDKPKRVDSLSLQRVANIRANPNVSLIVDHYEEDWSRLAWVQIRGAARVLETGPEHADGVERLHARYSQYAAIPLHERPLILIRIDRILSWRAGPVESET